jgi:hypothetical protein
MRHLLPIGGQYGSSEVLEFDGATYKRLLKVLAMAVRIPLKSNGHSNRWRTPIPIEIER